MALDVQPALDTLQSYLLASGWFQRVNGHEPKSQPGGGLSAAVWVGTVTAIARVSGLPVTSARVEFMIRFYSSLTQEPADAIDPELIRALSDFMNAVNGDFELGGEVMSVDILGAYGEPLQARDGYIQLNGVTFRVYTIICPAIYRDVWVQSP